MTTRTPTITRTIPTTTTTTLTTTSTTTSKATTKTVSLTTKINHRYPAVNNTIVNPHDKPMESHSISTKKSSDAPTSGGSSSNNGSSDEVPGWAIALLVLAAAILLLLIIIFIMMLVRLCCKKTESGYMDTAQDPYYNEKTQPPHAPALPMYSPPTPAKPEPMSTPVIFGDTLKKNRAGFYSVNP
ncbi:protein unzipped-like [Larimichthys crocea]|uniref:protein unzipped-like n=1 Tax=Larimichthys crocea TaxID=215358 RepID=UPI000F5F644B|nr:protein unzipped-like [Larimichthys crocea]